jgi:hypothetical protein
MIKNNTVYNANRVVLLWAALATFILTAQTIHAQERAGCQNGPLVKNLMPLRTPACNVPAAVSQELTKKEVKKLTAAAKSPEDHLKLAAYYKTHADRLDAEGATYEEATAVYRHGPTIKNLMAPNIAARYEYFAKGFREEAQSDRTLAASQQQMAKNAVAVAQQ